jgi:hypothetical protein
MHMAWQIGLVACAVMSTSFAAISIGIALSLGRSQQLRSNHMGRATALVLMICAIWPATAGVLLALPSLGVEATAGTAMRDVFGWPMTTWSAVAAVAVAAYWTMWRRDAAERPGAQLFVDRRINEQQALELNDMVLQGLVVAKMALDLDHPQRAATALEDSINSASRIITEMLGSPDAAVDLQRSVPASPTALARTSSDEPPHLERKSS